MSAQNQRQITVPIRQLSSKQVRSYFTALQSPGKNIALIGAVIAGILLILLGIAVSNVGVASIGILLAAGGILVFWLLLKMIPSDQEYDEWLRDQARAIRQNAFVELQIGRNDIIDVPLMIHSFVLPGSSLADEHEEDSVLMKKGKDGQWRFSVNYFTYVFPCHRYVAIFTQYVNAVEIPSRLHSWQNEEYPPRHIIQPLVLDSQDTALIEGEGCRCNIRRVCLTISNQEMIPLGALLEATLPGRSRVSPITLPGADVNRTFMSVRRLLRNY